MLNLSRPCELALLSPSEMLKKALDKMAGIWPLLELNVWGFPDLKSLAGTNELENQFTLAFGSNSFKHTPLDGYQDILLSSIEAEKPFFQDSDSDSPGDLIALIPLIVNSTNSRHAQINNPIEAQMMHKNNQGSVLCLWREGGTGPILNQKDKYVLELIISQMNLYSSLYNMMENYNRLLGKFRHDLRTPLTSVTMIAGLLQEEGLDQETQEFGQMLAMASRKMDELLTAFKTGVGD